MMNQQTTTTIWGIRISGIRETNILRNYVYSTVKYLLNGVFINHNSWQS